MLGANVYGGAAYGAYGDGSEAEVGAASSMSLDVVVRRSASVSWSAAAIASQHVTRALTTDVAVTAASSLDGDWISHISLRAQAWGATSTAAGTAAALWHFVWTSTRAATTATGRASEVFGSPESAPYAVARSTWRATWVDAIAGAWVQTTSARTADSRLTMVGGFYATWGASSSTALRAGHEQATDARAWAASRTSHRATVDWSGGAELRAASQATVWRSSRYLTGASASVSAASTMSPFATWYHVQYGAAGDWYAASSTDYSATWYHVEWGTAAWLASSAWLFDSTDVRWMRGARSSWGASATIGGRVARARTTATNTRTVALWAPPRATRTACPRTAWESACEALAATQGSVRFASATHVAAAALAGVAGLARPASVALSSAALSDGRLVVVSPVVAHVEAASGLSPTPRPVMDTYKRAAMASSSRTDWRATGARFGVWVDIAAAASLQARGRAVFASRFAVPSCAAIYLRAVKAIVATWYTGGASDAVGDAIRGRITGASVLGDATVDVGGKRIRFEYAGWNASSSYGSAPIIIRLVINPFVTTSANAIFEINTAASLYTDVHTIVEGGRRR